ncbi:MAG: TatD family hydrolase [Chitinispirillaceae bacterium]
MFDTHCHLQDERISAEVEGVISRAARSGIRRMLCCGTREQDWAGVSELASVYEEVCGAFGLHPWFIATRSPDWLQSLEKYLTYSPGAAIGEIGLDHTWEPRNDQDQAEVFIQQLDLARELKRPVSIHCRKAWGDLLKILQKRGGLENGGAIHSYSGPPDLIHVLEKLNCHISFSGSILNPRNKRAQNSLSQVSPERLLVETDSPDLLPKGVPGSNNEPQNLVLIVKRIADFLGKPLEEIAFRTEKNGNELFKAG